MVVLHIIRHYFTQGYLRKVFTKSVTRHFGGDKFTQWPGYRNLLGDNAAVDAVGSQSPSPKKSALDLRPHWQISTPAHPTSPTNSKVSTKGHCLKYPAAKQKPGATLFYRKHPSVAFSPCTKLLHLQKAIQISRTIPFMRNAEFGC